MHKESVISVFYLYKNGLVFHDLGEGARLWVTEQAGVIQLHAEYQIFHRLMLTVWLRPGNVRRSIFSLMVCAVKLETGTEENTVKSVTLVYQ